MDKVRAREDREPEEPATEKGGLEPELEAPPQIPGHPKVSERQVKRHLDRQRQRDREQPVQQQMNRMQQPALPLAQIVRPPVEETVPEARLAVLERQRLDQAQRDVELPQIPGEIDATPQKGQAHQAKQNQSNGRLRTTARPPPLFPFNHAGM